jgi:hypothetical protein
LLWSHYQFSVYYPGLQDNTELTRIADELRLSLQIDPNNQSARDLAMWVSESLPWALSQTERGYDFLVLTATPTLLPETATPASEGSPEPSATAPAPEPTRMVDKTATAPAAALVATNIPADPQKTPTGGNPLCGSVLVLPFLLGLIWFVAKQ